MPRLLSAALLAVSLLAACGSDTPAAPPWEADYRTHIAESVADATPAERAQNCATAAALTDDQLRAEMATTAGNGSLFDETMAARGETPTEDDYERALDIAIEAIRARCG